MDDVKFDIALSEFLDDDECERTSEAVYALIRAAFTAGWNAAAVAAVSKGRRRRES